MGANEKNRNELLSRIVADLFTNSREGEDLSAKIGELRDEIKKVIEHEDTLFGKFREVAESFREIIPEDTKRYSAAVKAMMATSKISRQEIVKAVKAQLEELKILEKILLSTTAGGRDELKAMETKAREIRDEISSLREKMGRLEREEKELLAGLAQREKSVEPAAKAVRQLFADISAEIERIKKRVEEPTTAERPLSHPVSAAHSAPGDDSFARTTDTGQSVRMPDPTTVPQDKESQKPCPMCGGRMDLQVDGRTWLCYACAYQELRQESAGSQQKRAGIQDPIQQIPVPENPGSINDPGSQKKCPMCGGRMDLQMNGEMWLCYSCAFEEPAKGGVQPSLSAVPLEPALKDQNREPAKEAAPARQPPSSKTPSKRKPCPSCSGQMKWLEADNTWQCPFCGYERRI